MSDYRLDFGSTISPSDADRLNYMLSIVSENDELEITMDSNDPEQVNTIVDVLEGNEFDVTAKGGDEGRKYRLIAHRMG